MINAQCACRGECQNRQLLVLLMPESATNARCMLSNALIYPPSPTSGPSHLSGHSLSPFLLALPQGLQVLELEQTNRRKRYSIYHPTVLSVSCHFLITSVVRLLWPARKGALSPITVGEVPCHLMCFLSCVG